MPHSPSLSILNRPKKVLRCPTSSSMQFSILSFRNSYLFEPISVNLYLRPLLFIRSDWKLVSPESLREREGSGRLLASKSAALYLKLR